MLQLAQQYQAAAGELKQDHFEYRRGASADRRMPEHAAIASALLRGQFGVLMHLAASPWPETEPLHSIHRKLYMSSEVATAALQALVAACEDLQVRYKDMARQQQLMKKKKKQQQQSGQQLALNPLLLKLTVPADHVNVGVPPGWKEGAVKPLEFSDRAELSARAYVCQIAGRTIQNHLFAGSTDRATGFVVLKSRDMGAAKSKLCRPEVMKLLLEAALLLQGTEPEAGVHHELQHQLHVLLSEASKEDALALLRERGGLLMQAATLSTAEEGVLEGVGRESVLWQQRQLEQRGTTDGSLVVFGWLNTLVRIASQVGKFSGNRYMQYMVLSGPCVIFFERVLGALKLLMGIPRLCLVF